MIYKDEQVLIRIYLNKALDNCNGSYGLLADAIEASDKSIYKWMNGTSVPDGAHLIRIMKTAGLAIR
jgi:succinate dehydrogenase flavin-adding protein (antitoxin of CptAB toxin-antitoxin module)